MAKANENNSLLITTGNKSEYATGYATIYGDEEIDTIGGLVMAISGCVPEKGDIIHINEQVVAEIIEATPRTIKQIKITYSF